MSKQHRRSQYSGVSRPSGLPLTLHRTRARRRREALLAVFLSSISLVLLAGLGVLAWYVVGFVTTNGGPDSAAEAASTDTPTLSVGGDYEVEPLVDLIAFRDSAYEPVRAVHVYSTKAADKASMGRIMDIIDRSELNAMVVAVKDDYGRIAYDSDAPMALEAKTVKPIIWGGDLDALVATFVERNVIPIARIVCFKDSYLTAARPELAIQNKETGEPWTDRNGDRYLNPFQQENWEYIVQVAEDVAKRGFREIQFDYVRFPAGADGDLSKTDYPGKWGSKEQAIAGFLAYARPRLEPLGVWISADVFGYVADRTGDLGIGQDLEKMCENLDLICPMVYPTLYEFGAYGIEYPPAEPYKLVKNALAKTPARMEGTGAKCRPWLQAYDDYYSRKIDYTPELIREEIKAAADLGFNEYLLWGGYPELGFQ